jgi:hypothetical protein
VLLGPVKRQTGPTIPEALSLAGIPPTQWSTLECAEYLKKNRIIEIKDTGEIVILKNIDGSSYRPGPTTRCPPAKATGYGFTRPNQLFVHSEQNKMTF